MGTFLRGLSSNDWRVSEHWIHRDKMQYQEALFTLGNGYLGSRGSLEEGYEQGYPATYIAGVYDRSGAQSFVIVNVPNPLGIEVYVDGRKLSIREMEVVEHHRALDMKRAVLLRRTVFMHAGREYEYESRRFFSLSDVHVGVLGISFRSLDGDVDVVVKHSIDGTTQNETQAIGEPIKHYRVTEALDLGDGVAYLEARTNDLGTVIGMAAAGRMDGAEPTSGARMRSHVGEESVTKECSFTAEEGVRYQFHLYMCVYTSRETEGDIKTACLEGVTAARQKGVSRLSRAHSRAWGRRWKSCDINVGGDRLLRRALRLDMYHLLAAAPPRDMDVSIAPKALSGEWYGGHVFWDTEIFMLPFFIHTQPELARAFLMYRYRRLEQALDCARKQNYKGALWPWESAVSGEDETPQTWINFDGTVLPVYTSLREHHIASDVVYAIYRYFQTTGDEDFLLHYGSEMVFETARFWESRVVYNGKTKAYEIKQVIGPNEFQEGVDNNSYTNAMTRWTLRYASQLYDWLGEAHPGELQALAQKIGLTGKEVERWREIADGLLFLMGADGLIEEFEGYYQKKEIIIRVWDEHGMPAWPSEVALAEVAETQLIKQADVVLLLYLLSDEFPLEAKRVNFDYYEPRTTHKSSLSVIPYGILAVELGDVEKAYKYLHHASSGDLEDIYGNTKLGVHAATLGGAWQIMMHGFVGLRVKNDTLSINPTLHESWRSIGFRTWFRGSLIEFAISEGETEASLLEGDRAVDLEIYGRRLVLEAGRTVRAQG